MFTLHRCPGRLSSIDDDMKPKAVLDPRGFRPSGARPVRTSSAGQVGAAHNICQITSCLRNLTGKDEGQENIQVASRHIERDRRTNVDRRLLSRVQSVHQDFLCWWTDATGRNTIQHSLACSFIRMRRTQGKHEQIDGGGGGSVVAIETHTSAVVSISEE